MISINIFPQVAANELAHVLIHAEKMRSAALDFPDIGVQAWRGGASNDLLGQCCEHASALADQAFVEGSGAFYDGDDDYAGGRV